MWSVSLLVLCIAAVAVNAAQLSADIVITRPSMVGQETGKFYYNDAVYGVKYELARGGNPVYYTRIELYDPDSDNNPDGFFDYAKCSSGCTVTSRDASSEMPGFNLDDLSCSGPAVTKRFGTCTVCTKPSTANQPVESLCLATTNDISTLVSAEMKNGDTIDFDNVGTTAAASLFSVPSSWNCALRCTSQLDVVLVLDESGSISSSEFQSMKTFAKNFANNFEIAPDAVHMGIVQFSTNPTYTISTSPHISSNHATVHQVLDNLARFSSGGTHLSKGVNLGYNILADQSGSRALRKDVGKVVVVATDGYVSGGSTVTFAGASRANPTGWRSFMESKGHTVVTVSVGSSINPTYLRNAASKDSAGDDLYFPAATFSDLVAKDLITRLGKAVCTATDAPPKCVGCKGSCLCDDCVCPSTCDTGSECTTGVCSTTEHVLHGCKVTNVDCRENDQCFNYGCDASSGCTKTVLDCDDNNACTTDTCDPAGGCVHTPISCINATNPCLRALSCDPAVGCGTYVNICNDDNACTEDSIEGNVPITCDDSNLCTLNTCNLTTGCVFPDINCDNDNLCTEAVCGAADGKCSFQAKTCDDNDPCTIDDCFPAGGCSNEAINATEACNDDNACTVDLCHKDEGGCYHTDVVCPNIYEDGCIEAFCDNKTGCSYREKTCEVSADKAECYIGVCSNGTCVETELNDCVDAVVVAAAAGLSTLAIALIIAGAVVLGCTGVVGGAAAIVKVTNPDFAFSNALYKPDTQLQSNQLYQGNN